MRELPGGLVKKPHFHLFEKEAQGSNGEPALFSGKKLEQNSTQPTYKHRDDIEVS